MKGELALKILETLGDVAVGSARLLEAFLNAGYGASCGKIERELRTLESASRQKEWAISDEKQKRQRYHEIISKLKRDGLLARDLNGNFRITFRGKQKRTLLKKRLGLSLPKPFYSKQESKNVIIVVFDVPERDRRKRNWLRTALKNLGLKMVQKSVWIGKTTIPRELVDHIQDLKLIECIEIFEVSKTGTLTQLPIANA